MRGASVIIDLDALAELVADRVVERLTQRQPPSHAAAELLSIPEASKLSGRGQRSLRDDIRAGRLRGYRAGRSVRVRRADVLALVEACPHAPPQPSVSAEDDFRAQARRLGLVRTK